MENPPEQIAHVKLPDVWNNPLEAYCSTIDTFDQNVGSLRGVPATGLNLDLTALEAVCPSPPGAQVVPGFDAEGIAGAPLPQRAALGPASAGPFSIR